MATGMSISPIPIIISFAKVDRATGILSTVAGMVGGEHMGAAVQRDTPVPAHG